jgi:hypothetical protein
VTIRRIFRGFLPHAVIFIVTACSGLLQTGSASFAAPPVVHIVIGIFIFFIHCCMYHIYVYIFIILKYYTLRIAVFFIYFILVCLTDFQESVY